MTVTFVKDIYEYIDSFAPFCIKAEWDNPGILVGDENSAVTKAVVALDITDMELAFAEKVGAQLIVSHHPVIFHARKAFLSGDVCYEAARRNISALCAHTNLDKAVGGVNDVLCEVLGMKYEKMTDSGEGFLNIGVIDDVSSAEQLAKHIAKRLGASVRYSDAGNPIGKIGVCSGAGADVAEEAALYGCTAFITGDASYHEFLDAKAVGVSLFAAGHYETEIIIVDTLIKRLSAAFPDVEFIPSERRCPVRTVT